MTTDSGRKRQRRPKAGVLEAAVTETVSALRLGPADAGLVALAVTLARSIDGMDAETRGRMLGQTSGQLLAVLRELSSRRRVVLVGTGSGVLDELRARAARRGA